jgi:GNAT superfamily N-acetyltransferase
LIHIRKSNSTDANEIWEILKVIIREGDSFVYSTQTTKVEMLDNWFSKNKHTYTALLDGKIVGTFFIQDNQPGLGSHIANAGYATSPEAYGQGIGKQMGIFSLDEARRLGYKAMQFNIVVKTNQRAVKLWQDIGFTIIGETPEAFQHQKLGLVNAYMMYQKL